MSLMHIEWLPVPTNSPVRRWTVIPLYRFSHFHLKVHQYSCLTIWCRINIGWPDREFVEPLGIMPESISLIAMTCVLGVYLTPTSWCPGVPTPSCKHFNDSSYRSRIYKHWQAGFHCSPLIARSPPTKTTLSQLPPRRHLMGHMVGRGPALRRHLQTHHLTPLPTLEGTARRRLPRLLTKEQRAWDLSCLP